jgi:hypothetical protein
MALGAGTCSARNVFGIEPIEMEGGHFPMLERPSELADVLVAITLNP